MPLLHARRMRSEAKTVDAYLQELPPERREVVSTVRDVILAHLPTGYVESMNWGMIAYEIPLAVYPKTYNKQPLMFAALAAQKNYFSVYLMGIYMNVDAEDQLRAAFEQAGKKLDMGKSCVRFKQLDDLPLEVIANAVSSPPPADFIRHYENVKGRS